MSLNWHLDKIKDYETVCWFTNDNGDKYMKGVTEALIHLTMAVDLGDITEKNYKEFYKRVHLWEQVAGKSVIRNGEAVHITEEEVKQHIGLSTNVINVDKFNVWLLKAASVALEKVTGRFFRIEDENPLCGEEDEKGHVCRLYKHDRYDYHDDTVRRYTWGGEPLPDEDDDE